MHALPYRLTGAARVDRYENGAIKSCTLSERNMLQTACGRLIPRYGPADMRRKAGSSVLFYRNGAVKHVSLERQQPIRTPLGVYPAEFVTFYESGALKRFFPLDGQISGFWSEEDDFRLLDTFAVSLSIGEFSVKLIGICFYENGAVRSLTFWPGEQAEVQTPAGRIPVRNGFSLYENGALRSLEPAEPVPVATPIGTVIAYDASVTGIHADENSLCFDKNGKVTALVHAGGSIAATDAMGKTVVIRPGRALSMLDDEAYVDLPVHVSFSKEDVALVSAGQKSVTLPLEGTVFTMRNAPPPSGGGGCAQCAGCSQMPAY